jgi:hypothetical protein
MQSWLILLKCGCVFGTPGFCKCGASCKLVSPLLSDLLQESPAFGLKFLDGGLHPCSLFLLRESQHVKRDFSDLHCQDAVTKLSPF